MQCPECGNAYMYIHALCPTIIVVFGTKDGCDIEDVQADPDPTWEQEDSCECPQCLYEGTVADFMKQEARDDE